MKESNLRECLSSKFTYVLSDIQNNLNKGKKTAKIDSLKEEARKSISTAASELKNLFSQIGEELNLKQNNISFQVGRWCFSGNVFSYIWASFYPVESGKISEAIPQLYLIRDMNGIKLGISLSALSMKKKEHVDEISSFFQYHLQDINSQLPDFELEKDVHNQHFIGLKKKYNSEETNYFELESEIIEDIKKIYTYYNSLIIKFREKKLLPIRVRSVVNKK